MNGTDQIIEESLRMGMRLIKMGKATLPDQSRIIPAGKIDIPLYNDQVLNKTQVEKLKKFKKSWKNKYK